MVNLAVMDKVKLTKPDSTRTTEQLQLRFKMAYTRLALSKKARIFGEEPTKEYVIAALWHFFCSMSEAEAEAFLATWFPKLEKALAEEMRATGGETDPAGGGPADPPTKLPCVEGLESEVPPPPRQRRRAR